MGHETKSENFVATVVEPIFRYDHCCWFVIYCAPTHDVGQLGFAIYSHRMFLIQTVISKRAELNACTIGCYSRQPHKPDWKKNPRFNNGRLAKQLQAFLSS